MISEKKNTTGGQIGEFQDITKKMYNLDEKICKPWKNIKKSAIFS